MLSYAQNHDFYVPFLCQLFAIKRHGIIQYLLHSVSDMIKDTTSAFIYNKMEGSPHE